MVVSIIFYLFELFVAVEDKFEDKFKLVEMFWLFWPTITEVGFKLTFPVP
jgi:hypothetical protein